MSGIRVRTGETAAKPKINARLRHRDRMRAPVHTKIFIASFDLAERKRRDYRVRHGLSTETVC